MSLVNGIFSYDFFFKFLTLKNFIYLNVIWSDQWNNRLNIFILLEMNFITSFWSAWENFTPSKFSQACARPRARGYIQNFKSGTKIYVGYTTGLLSNICTVGLIVILLIFRMSSEGAKRREEARAKYGDQLRATFKKVDKDNSGSATIDEMWWACPTIIRETFMIFKLHLSLFWSALRVFIFKVPGKKILLFSNFCIEMKKNWSTRIGLSACVDE